MTLLHETGMMAAPVPIYFETFAPAGRAARASVLMIHGGAHSGACYQRTADGRPGWAYVFAQRGYRVIVPDWPGTGRSGHVAPDALNGTVVVNGLGALMRSLGGSVILLTHSMSGAYGWRLAELHHELVHAVVGVAPAPPGNIQQPAPIYGETDATIETQASGQRVTIDKNKPVLPTRDFVERKLIGESRFFPRERLAEYAASLRPTPPPLVLERQNVHGSQLRVDDPRKLAGKRVLVITGTDDLDHAREVDGAIVTWLKAHGAAAEFCFLGDQDIVGNGHMLMMEKNSDQIADAIMDWLERGPLGDRP
jgi:pimeloyl-ACP methyl ester carboxylesterase